MTVPLRIEEKQVQYGIVPRSISVLLTETINKEGNNGTTTSIIFEMLQSTYEG